MKTHSILIVTLVLVSLSLTTAVVAQSEWSNSYRDQSDVHMYSGNAPTMQLNSYTPYRSQIYEVGTMNAPSDFSDPSAGSSTSNRPRPRKLGGGTDPGEQSENSPIGEPWILLLFALLACGVIAYRRMNIKHNSIMKKIFKSSFHEKLKMLLIAVGLMVASINTAQATVTIYAVGRLQDNGGTWRSATSTLYCHNWGSSGTTWPGQSMTKWNDFKVDGHQVWQCNLKADANTNIIFDGGNGSWQTSDKTITATEKAYPYPTYLNGTWYYSQRVCKALWEGDQHAYGGRVYFDNSSANWSATNMYLVIGHATYVGYYKMTQLGNTQLYYVDLGAQSWSDSKYVAIVGHSSAKTTGSGNPNNLAALNKFSDVLQYSFEYESTYMVSMTSGTNCTPISISYESSGYSAFNKSQTVKKYTSTDGGSTYSEATINSGTVTITPYKLTDNGTVSNSSNTGTLDEASETSVSKDAVYTGKVTLTASANTGYDFVGWFDVESGGSALSTNTSYTYNAPNSTKTIYARFKKKQYTVSYGVYASSRWGSIKLNSGSAVSTTSSSTLNHGTAIAFTATPNSGYQVEGWYSDADCSAGNRLQSGGTSYDAGTLTAAKTVYVKFEEKTGGIVTLNAGSHGQVSLDNSSWGTEKTKTNITTNTAFNIYAKGNSGYHFTSWTKNSGSGTIGSTSTANTTFTPVAYEDASLTAAFAETKSTIKVTTATTSWGSLKFGSTAKSWGTTASLGVETTQSITATAASGYKFVRWDLSGAAASSSTLTNATITLKANGSGNTGTATAVFEEDLSSPWIVAGGNKIVTTGTTWRTTADANNTMFKKTGHSTESVVYFTVPVSTVCSGDDNGDFQFKIYNTSTSTWYSLGADGSSYYLLKAEGGKAKSLVTDGKNIELRAYVTGNYEFKLDYSTSTPKLTVTWPVYNQLRFYSAQTGGTGTNTYDFNTASTPWTKTVNLTAGSTYWFKVIEDSEFFGNTGTMTRTNSSNWTMSNVTENCGITPDFDGDYTFSYNPSTHKLSVTYPATYTVTYNGNGKTSGDVPAVSYHIPASDVTLATNYDGILYKEGYAFNGWNTAATPSGSSTHYASGGTLANITANKTLYAEWVRNDYTMYFYNKDSWSPMTAYLLASNNDREKAWGGRAMTVHQGNVYKIDYNHSVQQTVIFNNNATGDAERKTGDLTIADGQSGDNWFYNDEDKTVNENGIHHGWSQYILVANFPTSTVAAVVGEKVTVVPTVVWADGINFADINITSTRTSGPEKINAVVSGTNIIVSGSEAGTATFNITYTYSTHSEATITKTLTVKVMNGLTIQAKIPSTDDHWVYSNIVKMHYWGGAGTNANPSFKGDVTMSWIKDGADGKYYQACVPVGTEATPETNFIFFYDNFNDAWRKTQDITNVTANSCYTIKHDAGLDNQRNAVKEGTGLCNDSWSIQITMGSGDIYTSNIVETSDDIVSFFAPSNASESQSYRRGVVTIEHNGASVATVPANTFSASGVYTAKINTTTPALTNVAPYTGDYYIRTNGADGGWDHYKDAGMHNKMTQFTRNANFPNETFSYYWVNNVAKGSGDPVNIKATVANDINPVLCNFSADDNIAQETHGVNLRFGYEPTTNELVRGILRGSNENNFLNLIGSTDNIYKDSECAAADKLDETAYSSHPEYSKLQDKSNWVYEAIVYAKIDNTHQTASVYLKSYYNGIHYLLGMVKDPETGEETSTPITFPVIKTGTSYETYGLRVIYDFKTNRLFAAWAPADINIDGIMNVDADVMFLRHEQGDVAQISFNTAGGSSPDKVAGLQKAIFALEIDDDSKISGDINRELHYFVTLPFDCNVKDIFGIGGYMNYWGIQRYRGDLRAQKGWFKETPTFWEWLGTNETMEAGKGYLVSIDKAALEADDQWKTINYQEKDGDEWVDRVGSILTLYFPSTTSGFNIEPASDDDLNITYTNEPCTITRENRDVQDSNWKCIGTPGYKNITITGYSDSDPDHHADPPYFLYVFTEKYKAGDGKTYLKGKYTPTSTDGFTFKSFNSYLVQFAGTINWARYSKESTPTPVAPRRMPSEEYEVTKAEINLLSDDNELLDRTFVWLHEDATTGFDQNYDLNKMTEKNANQIYSFAEHDVPFAANVLPLGTDTVQLVVNIVNEGEFTFSLNNDKHVGMAPVLYDMYQMTETDLLSADYTIDLKKGKYADRFFLIFKAAQPIVTSFETTADGGQNVHSSEAIYDVLGRRVNTIYPGHLYIVNGEKRIAK